MAEQADRASELLSLVIRAIEKTAPDLRGPGPDTPLIGDQAVLDSVGLVSLLITIESEFNGAVDLAAAFMEHSNTDKPGNPFRTPRTLAGHIGALLDGVSPRPGV